MMEVIFARVLHRHSQQTLGGVPATLCNNAASESSLQGMIFFFSIVVQGKSDTSGKQSEASLARNDDAQMDLTPEHMSEISETSSEGSEVRDPLDMCSFKFPTPCQILNLEKQQPSVQALYYSLHIQHVVFQKLVSTEHARKEQNSSLKTVLAE